MAGHRIRSLEGEIAKQKNPAQAYAAGFDAGRNVSHMGNSLFRFFLSDELTAAWENGYKAGQAEKARLTKQKQERKEREKKD